MTSRVKHYSGRNLVIQIVFLLAFIFLILRLFYIQIFQDDFIKLKIDSRIIHKDSLPAKRGKILDRNGRVLALDVIGFTLEIDNFFQPSSVQILPLANILEVNKSFILERANKKGNYKVLKRFITEEQKGKIELLNLPGLHYRKKLKRNYPQMEISSHVVGITDTERVGIEGTEKVLDRLLKGTDGIFKGVKGPIGVMEGVRNSPIDGQNLMLTIDIRLQSIAYDELKKAVEFYGASSGSIITINPGNGDILALTNFPSFNPSNRKNLKDLSSVRNRATIDVFQPGSVVKPFAMSAIIDSGKVKKNSKINTSPGWIELGGYKTRDFRDYGFISLSEIISYSSNVGMVKLCKDQNSDFLLEYLSNFGFGKPTSSVLIPTRAGFLQESFVVISDRDKVSLCYGYGLSMTLVQIAQAYQVFANKGVFQELNLFQEDLLRSREPQHRVISEDTANYINRMLFQAVNSSHGTGRKARIEGLHVAGKTGTAETDLEEKKSYTATFSGFAPANDPRLLSVVVLHDLTGKEHSGGSVAAPIFSRVMKQSLHALDVGSS